MTCNACKKQKKHSASKQTQFALTAVVYSMFEKGCTEDEVIQMLEHIDYVAALFAEDYLSFLDVRKVLKEEYGFELRFD